MRYRHAAVSLSIMGQLGGLYAWKGRPWMLQWGATSDERRRQLPGDDVVPNPTHMTTHAVTINAPPSEIWPWLVQMGQDRAGFYTHNWVEKLLLSGIPDIRDVHPEWQDLKVGDIVRTNRSVRPKQPPLGWPVAGVDPPRSLVLRSRSAPAGSYAFVLEPHGECRARLIVRDRAVWPWWQAPFRLLIFEPLHAYMETGVLRGIKQRVERTRETAMISHIQTHTTGVGRGRA